MGEVIYEGLPVPKEATLIYPAGEYKIYDIYAWGLLRFLVEPTDEDKIVSTQYIFNEDEE